jgi:general secretion pathway protein A
MTPQPLIALGLKWNPFSPDVPVEAIWISPRVDHFLWRIEHQVRDGGFALITGEPGTGKSVTLRVLADRLVKMRDVSVGVITHPRSRLADFYREMGELFGTSITACNRWGGFKALRERWLTHIDTTLTRPVLLIDEAQSVYPEVLTELRLLASTHFDSRAILTVVLVGDQRLPELFRTEELLPLGSRIRVRLAHEPASQQELLACLAHRVEQAGNAQLLTPALAQTLCEHALGNYRVLCTMAGELLDAAVAKELRTLDEKLYLEVFAPPASRKSAPGPAKAARR